ncbi:MAG TPA: YmdB family metallophosphoesterase, partial [Candidatus Sumerlaeia bacterium]|nr:YmdB family metallophosphoesterase [Candidatus Sumerlaeia bacterium]
HAEATSEKIAMGWYLDGKASAVIGTHTHVQTADEQILPNGTAYITDAGMTGPHDGVIGVQKQIVLENMLTRLPVRHKLAEGNIRLNAILLNIDAESGRAVSIERISKKIKASNGAV